MPLPPAAQHQAADEDGVNDGPFPYPPTLKMISGVALRPHQPGRVIAHFGREGRALAAAGLPAPRVVLVDRGEVAGNWSGRQGCTSGLLPLGTPPEKDVGYPYAASWAMHPLM
jgi:hypothetical protein